MRGGRARRRGSCTARVGGSCLRLIDFCITQLKAQGPSRTCNESKEEKKVEGGEGVSFQPWDLMVLDNKRACWWKTVTVSESGLG